MNPVIAGNSSEYQYLMKSKQIPRLDAVRMYPFVSMKEQLMSVNRHTTVILYGTYLKRKDWDELDEICRYRMFLMMKIREG